MRPQETTPMLKLAPASPTPGARTSAGIRWLAIDRLRYDGTPPGNGAPGPDSFDIHLARPEALTGRSPIAAFAYLFPPTHMRDSVHVDVLVPLLDNEGVAFPESAFDAFERVLLNLAGGYTCRGTVEGAWRAPDGTVMRDVSRSYVVTLDARDAAQQIERIDRFIRAYFRQHAAFLELTPTKATVF
jgi:hypothetical protein